MRLSSSRFHYIILLFFNRHPPTFTSRIDKIDSSSIKSTLCLSMQTSPTQDRRALREDGWDACIEWLEEEEVVMLGMPEDFQYSIFSANHSMIVLRVIGVVDVVVLVGFVKFPTSNPRIIISSYTHNKSDLSADILCMLCLYVIRMKLVILMVFFFLFQGILLWQVSHGLEYHIYILHISYLVQSNQHMKDFW